MLGTEDKLRVEIAELKAENKRLCALLDHHIEVCQSKGNPDRAEAESVGRMIALADYFHLEKAVCMCRDNWKLCIVHDRDSNHVKTVEELIEYIQSKYKPSSIW